MNNRRKFELPPIVGGVSLFVVFAVLCLSVFALLSVATARADSRMAEASVKAIENYYAADLRAQEILAQLRAGKMPDGVSADGNLYSYRCPISKTQSLTAEVRMEGSDYAVIRWQAVNAGEWETDGGLNLWDGEADKTE